MENRIRIGISTCLLGEKVRYDGGHKHDRFITQILGPFMEFVPVCPEVEAGFGIPREAFHLEGDIDHPRLITVKTHHDHTDRMVTWAQNRIRELESEALCGFIFKSKSPSSGLFRVKVYNRSGMPVQQGVGLFARAFTEHFPLLPVEEDGRLYDMPLRENFIERIFVYHRWQTIQTELNPQSLIAFHTRHKLLIMAHSPEHYRLLGKLTASVTKSNLLEKSADYVKILMEGMRMKSTIKKNINVLQHVMGYFKKNLAADEKQEMLEIIDQYRNAFVPLIVPITLLNHYIRKYEQPYLKEQYYMNPHPLELQLRNHV